MVEVRGGFLASEHAYQENRKAPLSMPTKKIEKLLKSWQ